MVAADLESRITAWNLAASRMFGAGSEEMLGADWTTIVPTEGRTEAEQVMAASLTQGKVGEFEFDMRNERGGKRRLAAIVTPVVDQQGQRIGGLACVRDITNRMILQERFVQQSRMAALGEMAGALAHHFNNILGGVVTSVDFALATGDLETLTRGLEKTASALSRATELVESLLAFAEGDYRNESLSDLTEVVVGLIESTERRLRGSRIRLTANVRKIPVLAVPHAQVITVLSNLIENAVEAMPERGDLTIELDSAETYCFIRVGDTGPGLTEAELNRIFEPFYSTKDKTAVGKSGRGLGLAVAHGVLKVLRGSIHVTSTLGQGTTFEVRLPLPSRETEQSGQT